MIYNNTDSEKRAVIQVADLIMAAARTAPKGCGVDNLETIIIDGEEKDKLVAQMRKITEDTGESYFARDAGNVDACPVVVLIGIRNKPLGLDHCSYCGFENCAETKKAGGNCAFNIMDLGIAIGSAVSVAANHRIDNRVMFSIGKAAIKLKYLPEDVRVAYGVPLSTSGNNIFFDRASGNVDLSE